MENWNLFLVIYLQFLISSLFLQEFNHYPSFWVLNVSACSLVPNVIEFFFLLQINSYSLFLSYFIINYRIYHSIIPINFLLSSMQLHIWHSHLFLIQKYELILWVHLFLVRYSFLILMRIQVKFQLILLKIIDSLSYVYQHLLYSEHVRLSSKLNCLEEIHQYYHFFEQ